MKLHKKQTEDMTEADILSREMLSICEVAFLLRVTDRQVRNLIYIQGPVESQPGVIPFDRYHKVKPHGHA